MDLFDQLRNTCHEGTTLAENKRKPSNDGDTNNSSKDQSSSSELSSEACESKTIHSFKKSSPKYEGDVSFKKKNMSKKQEVKSSHSAKKHDTNSSKNNDHTSKNHDQKLAKFNDKHKSHNSGYRRESMPSPVLPSVESKSKKSRSLSPPKYEASNAVLKSLKVKVERKNLDDFLRAPINAQSKICKSKQDKVKDVKEAKQKLPLKATPTKAQQKLFEPVRSKKSKAQILKDFNIKKCAVRIRRDNLKQLMRDFKKNRSNSKNATKRGRPRKRGSSADNDVDDDDDDLPPPAKKSKMPPLKIKSNFFIKLSSSKMEKKTKLFPRSSSSAVAHNNKIKNSRSSGLTAPTKFSRSQLIRSFGKRFFTSFVRIEKCTHPLLLTFESNDRARRLQTKRSKSKNLSVSFREQVEVFGDTSDSDNSYDENFCVVPQAISQKVGRRANAPTVPLAIVPATPVVMPARLKKVENGKVVDDIELDPALFLDPQNMVSSTPYSPGRKKRDRKSFSPLKDEGSPSPRKEQLKLANEKIPPSGLRRLNIDEEDDEDDDCEYIVPIELPQRRTSRASSTNTLDSGPTLFPTTPAATIADDIIETDVFDAAHANEEENEPAETVAQQASAEMVAPGKSRTPTPTSVVSPPTPTSVVSPPMLFSPPTPPLVAPTPTLPLVASPSAPPLVTSLPTPPLVTSPPMSPRKEPTPTPIAVPSPTVNIDTSPISSASIADYSEPDEDTVADEVNATHVDIAKDVSIAVVEDEEITEETPAKPCKEGEETSNESFKSAKGPEPLKPPPNGNDDGEDDNRPTSLSPTSALKDVIDRVAASVIETACGTQPAQDTSEINGTGVSLNDMTMNLFIEDDSQADGDSPDKSFVDSIINETIDKLGKDIDEGGSPVDEQFSQAT